MDKNSLPIFREAKLKDKKRQKRQETLTSGMIFIAQELISFDLKKWPICLFLCLQGLTTGLKSDKESKMIIYKI